MSALYRPDMKQTSTLGLKCGRPSGKLENFTQNFRQCQSRWKTGIRRTRLEGKLVGDVSGVRSGRGALSQVPDNGERRNVCSLRTVRTSASYRFRVYVCVY
ncbi:hypothetical protein ACLB2K_007718 [Fragaria x ananassa]